MQGLLFVDKPVGWTSFDVVNYVRGIVARAEEKKPRLVKVGHSGTLDPFATGLMILLISKDYTRRAAEFSKLDKTYELTMQLGTTSSTGDPEGELTQKSDLIPDLESIKHAIEQFTGPIQQTPPPFSAIKIDGQRAYKLARAGKAVALSPRPVTIESIEVLEYTYPQIKLLAKVSSGTYIRTLVEDIGAVLGTGAYTTALRRVSVGRFSIQQAQTVTALSPEAVAEALKSQA